MVCIWQHGLDPRCEVGPHAALEHLAGKINFGGLGRGGNADGNRSALANFVFQNAEGLVKRGDEEIHDPVANSLFARFGVCRNGERGGAGNVGCHQQGAHFGIE